MPAMSIESAVLKIKEGGKLCKYCSGSFIAECNYPTIEKEILALLRGVEKLLIFSTPKPFLI